MMLYIGFSLMCSVIAFVWSYLKAPTGTYITLYTVVYFLLFGPTELLAKVLNKFPVVPGKYNKVLWEKK